MESRANSSTKITFSQPVNFGGKSVEMGTYALFIVPTEKEWKIILNKDSQQWGAYEYDASKDVADVTVPVQKVADKEEWFEISFNPVNDHQTDMEIKWDHAKAVVQIKADRMDKINRVTEKLNEAKAIMREK